MNCFRPGHRRSLPEQPGHGNGRTSHLRGKRPRCRERWVRSCAAGIQQPLRARLRTCRRARPTDGTASKCGSRIGKEPCLRAEDILPIDACRVTRRQHVTRPSYAACRSVWPPTSGQVAATPVPARSRRGPWHRVTRRLRWSGLRFPGLRRCSQKLAKTPHSEANRLVTKCFPPHDFARDSVDGQRPAMLRLTRRAAIDGECKRRLARRRGA